MDKINSKIKLRILKLSELLESSKQIFFQKTGLNYGNYKGTSLKSDVNSEAIEKLYSTYPQINLEWLITGDGKMLKNEVREYRLDIAEEPTEKYGKGTNEIILELIKQNGDLREEIGRLKNVGKMTAENA